GDELRYRPRLLRRRRPGDDDPPCGQTHPPLPPGGHRRHASASAPDPRRGGDRLRGHPESDQGDRLRRLDHHRAVPVHQRPRPRPPDGAGADERDPERRMNSLHPYAQLVRLPALPTALADIALGALATRALPERWPAFLLLLGASGCLYSAGMVFNDFFDVDQDRRERPDRPIPSGRVTRRQAGLFAAALMAAGLLLATLAGLVMDSVVRPAVLAGGGGGGHPASPRGGVAGRGGAAGEGRRGPLLRVGVGGRG